VGLGGFGCGLGSIRVLMRLYFGKKTVFFASKEFCMGGAGRGRAGQGGV
jgi:hypothetical protein